MIRDFEMQDFERIIEINNSSFEYPQSKSFLLENIEKGRAWVFVEREEIVGFLIGKYKNDTPYIHTIAIDIAHRGKGFATKLIKKFEEFYGTNQKVENRQFWLQVQNDNPAQKLYFDLGYRTCWVDENYYGRTKHALCMFKSARPAY
jgi:ribosomal protein S18 acetylase RimI-like enzyme